MSALWEELVKHHLTFVWPGIFQGRRAQAQLQPSQVLPAFGFSSKRRARLLPHLRSYQPLEEELVGQLLSFS